MKGSIGTATHVIHVKDKRKKFKAKNGEAFCYRCKRKVRKGEWISPFANRLYKHSFKCPTGK